MKAFVVPAYTEVLAFSGAGIAGRQALPPLGLIGAGVGLCTILPMATPLAGPIAEAAE